MKLGIFTVLFGDWPLAKVAPYVSGLGYKAMELSIWAGNTHLSLDGAAGFQHRRVGPGDEPRAEGRLCGRAAQSERPSGLRARGPRRHRPHRLAVHPTGIAYNIETAQKALAVLDNRPEFGLNFDPSHLVWQLIDPVIFIKSLGRRIVHCHAKDGELQEDEVRRAITSLVSAGHDYVLSFEHEDPVMSPEDGAEKAIEYLRPLIIKKPLTRVWW